MLDLIAKILWTVAALQVIRLAVLMRYPIQTLFIEAAFKGWIKFHASCLFVTSLWALNAGRKSYTITWAVGGKVLKTFTIGEQ